MENGIADFIFVKLAYEQGALQEELLTDALVEHFSKITLIKLHSFYQYLEEFA